MKTILVPTDFSPNANNAINFAMEFAKTENAKLILLNVFETNYGSGAVPYDIIAEEKASLEIQSQKKLQEIGSRVELSGKVKCECISAEGFAVDVILNLIETKHIDLIIMGTKGATGFAGAIFGTNTAKVIEHAKCPVIAVPEGATFSEIKKITYTTDYLDSDIEGLKKAIEIAEPFKAQLNVLHISLNTHSPEKEKTAMKAFMNEVDNKTNYNNLSFQLLNGISIENVLEEYLENNSTNLIVMSTQHRNLFDKIFGSSITKHMAYHTKIPLLALHHDS